MENTQQAPNASDLSPIRYSIFSAEMVSFAAPGESAQAFSDRYSDALVAALGDAFPGREIEVTVKHKTTGYGSGALDSEREDYDIVVETANRVLETLAA